MLKFLFTATLLQGAALAAQQSTVGVSAKAVDVRVAEVADSLPISPGRVVSFETTEGSLMNLDVSPDGRTIVFDLVGDIYTVPTTGGTATQITRGLALDMHPVWAPDGKRIAYVSDAS